MKKILVVSPHADDETLGCGASLLKFRARGCQLHWLLMTEATAQVGFSSTRIQERKKEITQVGRFYGFKSIHSLGLPAARLDGVSKSDLIKKTQESLQAIRPDTILVPFPHDAHSDHRATFEAVLACAKSFRAPFVHRIWAYETLSETGFGNPFLPSFLPNIYVNVSGVISKKIKAMRLYRGELAKHPFPRSEKAIQALAELRGGESGFAAAEAFMLVKERKI